MRSTAAASSGIRGATRGVATGGSGVDFDEEGRKLMSELGIEGSIKDPEEHMSPIWRHPKGGGKSDIGYGMTMKSTLSEP